MASKLSTYTQKFQVALARSSELFLPEINPHMELDQDLVIDRNVVVSAICKDFLDGVVTNPYAMIGGCFQLAREASYVLFECGLDHTLTIGNVHLDGKPYFTTTLESLKEELQGLISPNAPANAHAWLTLQTGQVVDVTILASSAHKAGNLDLTLEDAIFVSTDEESRDICYEPLMTGFGYHLTVVSNPAVTNGSYERYCKWIDDTAIYKRIIGKARTVSGFK